MAHTTAHTIAHKNPLCHHHTSIRYPHFLLSNTHHKDNPGWSNEKKHAYIPSWQLAVFWSRGLEKMGKRREFTCGARKNISWKFCSQHAPLKVSHVRTGYRRLWWRLMRLVNLLETFWKRKYTRLARICAPVGTMGAGNAQLVIVGSERVWVDVGDVMTALLHVL